MGIIIFLGDSITDAGRKDSPNQLGYGYVNREDLTREKFTYIDGFEGLPYRSGDLT